MGIKDILLYVVIAFGSLAIVMSIFNSFCGIWFKNKKKHQIEMIGIICEAIGRVLTEHAKDISDRIEQAKSAKKENSLMDNDWK